VLRNRTTQSTTQFEAHLTNFAATASGERQYRRRAGLEGVDMGDRAIWGSGFRSVLNIRDLIINGK